MFNLGADEKPKKSPDGNMLPVINMTFLLVLFFIVVGNFSETFREDITPPQSSSDIIAEDTTPELALTKDGKLWWQEEETSVQQWAKSLQTQGEALPTRVRLRADGAIPAAIFIPIMDEFKRLKITRVALITVNTASMH